MEYLDGLRVLRVFNPPTQILHWNREIPNFLIVMISFTATYLHNNSTFLLFYHDGSNVKKEITLGPCGAYLCYPLVAFFAIFSMSPYLQAAFLTYMAMVSQSSMKILILATSLTLSNMGDGIGIVKRIGVFSYVFLQSI